jgi:hypothetical protein
MNKHLSLGMWRLCWEAADEIQRLRKAIDDIREATINGRVCDDVAWFSQIETLHDFCESTLEFTSAQGKLGLVIAAESSPSSPPVTTEGE